MRKAIALVAFAITWGVFAQDAKKYLTTKAHGPGGGSAMSLSSRYKGAGLGQGHTWTDKTFASASDFVITWNCGLEKSANCYAWGYKVGCGKDDGNLDGGKDVAINESGDNATDKTKAAEAKINNPYDYDAKGGATGLDSFFYRWIAITLPETSTAGEELFEGMMPEVKGASVTALAVPLPTEQNQEVGYGNTVVEAIFSKEYFATDDMGDINHDYIPDTYVQTYRFGIVDADGKITGDDMDSLATYNADLDKDGNAAPDYFPVFETVDYAGFIPALSNLQVITQGRDFTAKLEIRGLGDGLNDAPVLSGVSDVESPRDYRNPTNCPTSTLSRLEWEAFTNYCVTATPVLDPADTNSWKKWSPERPTNPMLNDTDGDGLTDGYEYYIWYRAHVGYYDTDGSHKYYEGRRYDPKNPLEPEILSPARIAQIYDPLVDFGSDYQADTDNDGLPDRIEFMIGTYPFDYDTDGDGLSDGYEILWLKTDPLRDATSCVEKDCDQISVSDISCECDGLQHSIRLSGDSVLTNYLVYSNTPLGPFLSKKPTYSEPGTYTNWCYVATQSANGPVHFAVVHISEKMVRIPELCGMPVPEKWILQYPSLVACSDNDLATALMKQTGKRDAANNMLRVWQDYVAGTNPTNEDDVFKASITKDENGKIIISHTPEFKDENEKKKRKYTTLGKKSLMDATDWEVVPEGHEADYNFFKVTVEMQSIQSK